MSLKELLRWCYSRQLVDVMTGTTIADSDSELEERREPMHETSLDGISSLIGDTRRRLPRGAGPARWNGHADVHPYAEMVHQAVLGLPRPYARLLVEFGRTGMHPEPCEPMFRPRPFLPNVGSAYDRPEQGYWRGEWMEYRVTADETVIERRPIYVRTGRSKVKARGEETVRVPVEYCPIEMYPDAVWVEACNGIAAAWDKALSLLADAMPWHLPLVNVGGVS